LAKDALAVSSLSKSLLKLKEFELTNLDPIEIAKWQKARNDFDRNFDAMLASSPDGGKALAEVGRKFLKMAEKGTVRLRQLSDGTYTDKPEKEFGQEP